MSDWIEYKLPCPKCGSSDAVALNSNGWGKCFSCQANIPPSNVEKLKTNTTTKVNMQTSNTEPYTQPQLVFKDIKERRLNKTVCEAYGVGFKGDDIHFPIGDAAQIRINGEKKFKIVGNFKDNTDLFGQERFQQQLGTRFIIVTEGQFDAMAAHQMLGFKTPVVSVRNGVSSAVKDIKANYEYLDQFDQVLFCFDNDEPGKKAQEECCQVMSHKAYTIQLPSDCKDANDCLLTGNQTAFTKAFWGASRWTPDGIICGGNLYDDVMAPLEESQVDYPFEELNKLTYGIREGELVLVTAGSGLGKSQFLREIVWHIMQNTDDNIGLMFMEESTRKTGLSLMSLAADKPLHLPTTKATQEEKDAAFKQTLGTDRLYFFDHFGSNSVDNIVNRVRYMSKVMGCKYVFLDHISIIVSGQENGDERKALDEVMTKLRTLVQETNICLIAVSHLKRPNDKGHEEGAATSLAQLRGSGSIAQLSDIVIGLERNGQADDAIERNTTYARVLKNRFSGMTGPAGAMLYDGDTGRMNSYVPEEEAPL